MKIGVIFPGYGSQYVGMGKELYDEFRIVQEYFEEASNCLNVNFVKLCFASSDIEISKIEQALIASFLVSSSLFVLLKEQEGIKPDMVMGHTSGEYAAIFASGGMNFPDMLYLLQKYVGFYQEFLNTTPIKAIRVVGLDHLELHEIIKEYQQVFISVYESETEHVVVGSEETVAQIQEQALRQGAKKVVEEPVVESLHCPLMSRVQEQINVYSEKVDFKDLQIPLLTNTDVRLITTKDEVKQAMLDYIISPVRWNDCVKKLIDYDLLIEIGPGVELSSKLRKLFPEKRFVAVNKVADIELLRSLLAAEQKETNHE